MKRFAIWKNLAAPPTLQLDVLTCQRKRRFRATLPVMLITVIVLCIKLLFFAAIQSREPGSIYDTPEGLEIEFAVEQAAVLTLERCVSGYWNVTGATNGIRVNGKNWEAPATGNYSICNQPQLSPSLEVRLPSSAIAHYTLDVEVVFGDSFHLVALIVLVIGIAYIMGVPTWSHRTLLIIIGIAHGGIVILYQIGTDLSIKHMLFWGKSLHLLPMEDLRHSLLESILYVHHQPPFFSIYGLALESLFGNAFPVAMYIVHVLMGICMCLMSYVILWRFTRNKTFAFLVSLLLALNPGYFFYEALGLYTMLSAFLILSATYCIVIYQYKKLNRYLYLVVLFINLLILTRSAYHIIILGPVCLLVLFVVRDKARSLLVRCLFICLLSFGFYAKNLIVYQSFSSSSWLGMGLWRVARDDYDANELTDLYQDGVLTDQLVIWFLTFLPPSAYPGYDLVDNGIRVASQDNANNAIYPKINSIYLDNALRLIHHDVWRYLRGAMRAYGLFSCPSSTWNSLEKNLAAFPASHQALSVTMLHMQGVSKEAARILGMSPDDFGVCSNLYFIIPLLMLACPLVLLATCQLRWQRWRKMLRARSALVFIWGMVGYTALVTSLLESGENTRFKFMIEIPLFILIAVVGYHIAIAIMGRMQHWSSAR